MGAGDGRAVGHERGEIVGDPVLVPVLRVAHDGVVKTPNLAIVRHGDGGREGDDPGQGVDSEAVERFARVLKL